MPVPYTLEVPFSGSEIDVRPILVQCELAPAAESGGDCRAPRAPAGAKLGPGVYAGAPVAPFRPPPIALATSPHPPSGTSGLGYQLSGVGRRPALGARNPRVVHPHLAGIFRAPSRGAPSCPKRESPGAPSLDFIIKLPQRLGLPRAFQRLAPAGFPYGSSGEDPGCGASPRAFAAPRSSAAPWRPGRGAPGEGRGAGHPRRPPRGRRGGCRVH